MIFGFFAASYFVVLRVNGVFGFFAASYFVVLQVGGVFGVFAASCEEHCQEASTKGIPTKLREFLS